MVSVDIFSCYGVAGVGAWVGLGLMSLVRTDQHRVGQALVLYRCAFACLGALAGVLLAPAAAIAQATQVLIGFAGIGLTLLAWAFRQLNGRRTPVWLGLAFSAGVGLVLWGFALLDDARYELALALTFSVVSLGMAIDQGWLILRSARLVASEVTLLVVAAGFALHWLVFLSHVLAVPGPYPPHWLHGPAWLVPISGLGFAVLPLAVAAVVMAIINGRLNQQLQARALSDDLTGALSRRGLRELGHRLLALQERRGGQVAVMMLDVDHFKAVNDRHGHVLGDQVLQHLTGVLRDQLQPDALLARLGGQEFSMVLPIGSVHEAQSVGERLRAAVQARPCQTRQGPIPVTVSIGVSFHDSSRSLEDELARADLCLRQAKQNGRNRVVVGPLDC